MSLMVKQLIKELFKNRVFVGLLLTLSIFASFMYFFVQFSIDGNITMFDKLPALSNNESLYLNALNSNSILAFNFLIVLSVLTSFVFAMFYYRFFRKNKKQIGCLKSLGFNNRSLAFYFVVFTAILTLLGAVIGLALGYLGSSVLINSNTHSYAMSGLIKGITISHLSIGFLTVSVVSCLVTLLCYGSISRKETGILLAGINSSARYSRTLQLTNQIAEALPTKDKIPIRIALRKPVAVLMIVSAVMGCTVMFIIGNSLNLSSGKVFLSQTEGHHYLFDTRYDTYREQNGTLPQTQIYLFESGTLKQANGNTIEQQIVGLGDSEKLLSLADKDRTSLEIPMPNHIYISSALVEMYGFREGDTLLVNIGTTERILTVAGIAANATSGCAYVSRNTLADILNIQPTVYNGVFSMKPLNDGGVTTTREHKLDTLNRASVSNQNSAIINQFIGCLVGCILIFLALILNFQDSTRDMLILHLIGYSPKAIKKTLIDIYKPVLWISFFVMLWPCILIAKTVQKSLSVQTGDYMPFSINILIIVIVFALLNIIYIFAQSTFNIGIKRIIAKEEISEYTIIE